MCLNGQVNCNGVIISVVTHKNYGTKLLNSTLLNNYTCIIFKLNSKFWIFYKIILLIGLIYC